MSTWVRVEDIASYEGQRVELRGWLARIRSSGKLHFLQVRDGSGRIQAVVTKATFDEERFKDLKRLGTESAIIVRGQVTRDERSKIGYEVQVDEVEVVSESEGYPITPKEHGTDFLMEHRHLWIRTPRQHAVLRIRATIMKAMQDWLDDHGFLRVDTPILTPAACEGTTTLFETDYFEEKAFLSQSGQLYNEATAAAFGKVYTFGPTFRAEKSKTRRHLMEFWMCEPEIAYCDFQQNMEIQEQFLSYVVQTVLEKRALELDVLERDTEKLAKVKAPFPRITYDEAVARLKEKGVEFEDGNDFGGTDETLLSEDYETPIFVTHFPTAIKAFYMKPDPNNPARVLGADVLAPEGYGEIIGGGERISDLALLEQRVAEHELPIESYQWYLDLRRYGSVPHSGFGIGLERTVSWICGLSHVRETGAFPRMLTRMYP
ncbi:MAG: asparagine--tRNA ligase [Vulcanimicrobiota bacterium]